MTETPDLMNAANSLVLAAKRRDAPQAGLIAALAMMADARRILAADCKARFPGAAPPKPKPKPVLGFYRLRSE